MTVAFEAAADHPLIESLEPAEAATAIEVHEGGVDDLLHGRVPSERELAVFDAMDAHPASGDDRESECAIVDGDDLHSFLFAAVESGFGDGPVRSVRSHRLAVEFHGGHAEVFTHAGKGLSVGICGMCMNCEGQEDGGRFEECFHGVGVDWVCIGEGWLHAWSFLGLRVCGGR